MSKATKTISHPKEKFDVELEKALKAGWCVCGYEFASEGPSYVCVRLERDSAAPKAKPAPKKAAPKAKAKPKKKAVKKKR